MTERDKANDELETLFAQARAQRPGIPDGLTDRILADALAFQEAQTAPKPAGETHTGSGTDRVGIRGVFGSVFGGWPALGGMVAAALVGVWIGAAPPAFVPDAAQILSEADADLDVFDAIDLASLLTEDTQ
ncbi:MAG: hypothetical protein GJ676_11620 [Rhodobacteraceae bacterium]|nr:hypothetical protein [Paracoccaceae bacterium]